MFPMRLMRQQLANNGMSPFLRTSLKRDTHFLQNRNFSLKGQLVEFVDATKNSGPFGPMMRAVIFGSTGALFFGTVSGLYSFGKTLKSDIPQYSIEIGWQNFKEGFWLGGTASAFVAALPKTTLFLGAGFFAATMLQDRAVKNYEIKREELYSKKMKKRPL